MNYSTAIRAALARDRRVIIGYGKHGPIYAIAGGDGRDATTVEDQGLLHFTLEDLRGKTPDELHEITELLEVQIRDMHQTDTGELRDLDDSGQKAFDLAMQVRAEAIRRIEEHRKITEALRQRPKAVERVRFGGYGDDPAGDVRRLTNAEARDRALRVLDDRTAASHLTAPQKDEINRQVRKLPDIARRIIVTENEAYREAWLKAITDPNGPARWTDDERQAMQAWYEYRAMSEGVTTAGGFGVPVFIDPSIILTAQESDNPFLQIATVSDITTNAWKGVSSAGVTWAFTTEAAASTDQSPTLAQPTVTAFMARGFIPFSIEVGEDYPGFASEMATLLSVGYNELLIDKFTRGSGTNEPKGVITALDATAASEVLLTTAAAFGAVDVHKVWNAVPQKFRRTASWLMPVDNNSLIAQFGTALGANYTVNLTESGVERIRGRAVYETPYISAFTATTAHQNVLVVGDFRTGYRVARRGGMSVELIPMMFDVTNNLPTGQRGWFAYARIGGDVVAAPALRLLNQT